MSLLRYTGLLLLFIVPCAIGINAGRGISIGEKQSDGFLEMMEYIKDKIKYFKVPAKEIYRNFENDALEKAGFLESLRKHENDEIYLDVWKTAFLECRENLMLSDKEATAILEFGNCIGNRGGQLLEDSFDYYINELRLIIEEKKRENSKNIRMYRVIGITAGAALVLMAL